MAMILALIALALGSLLITPTLSYSATGIKSVAIQERRVGEQYAADAGIEEALWQLTEGGLGLSEGEQATLSGFEMNNTTVNATVQRVVGAKVPTYELI